MNTTFRKKHFITCQDWSKGDLDMVFEVAKYLKKGVLVVIESTVAPGTTENIVKPILEKESNRIVGKDFYLAFSYERVMVGRLLNNITNLPRIIGGIDKKPGVVNDKIEIRNYLHVTLTVDHDLIDGSPLARLVSTFIDLIENAYGLAD